MNFSDVFNKAFVEGFSNTDLGLMEIVMVFGMAVLLGGYIFWYIVLSQRLLFIHGILIFPWLYSR